ncbi:kinase-like domain-containing protein [Fimicolochytrium jonesii]|uniref:kinase-like domain-containing protein n=1 Tax=Fimicolochytrium jonesii TaxID=1396493 RepID=UPI0022FE984A|nr:kinase-like domain-containing protein [Fimicolochytrium jonesii]KAI8819981.1 kinase-like domain-containing protein [Fimicolochytrium jonesii]
MSKDQTPRTPPRNARQRLCRNVVIHGFCKFENKGCEYNHDATKATPGSQPSSSPDLKSKLRVDSPIFTPTSLANTVNNDGSNLFPYATTKAGDRTSARIPTGASGPGHDSIPTSMHQPYDAQAYNYYGGNTPGENMGSYGGQQQHQVMMSDMGMGHAMARMSLGPSAQLSDGQQQQGGYYQQSSDEYYPQQQQMPMVAPQQPLQYHLYTTPLPHISNLHPHQKTIHAFFMADKLREELQRKSEAIQQVLDTTSPEYQRLPSEIHHYHSFYPLDVHRERSVKVFGYPTWVYKAFSSNDGKPYVLRRVEGFRLTNEAAMSSAESWRRIRHSNIVSVREAFTTKAFGDHSLVFVYDYHPLSTTLYSKYFSQPAHNVAGVPEKNLWSFITQLASALKTIHSAGLAARIIEPSKILLTGKNRIRLNCCGIFDMLTFNGGKNTPHHQQEDLLHFGQLIVALACGSLAAVHNLSKSIEYIVRHYSADMKNVILYLLSKPSQYKTIDDVVTMIGPRILHEINSAHHYNDLLEGELTRELENGRLVRLLCKLGCINERPEFDMDRTWSETGDRYLLKLFRDYVFHQVDEDGTPITDMAHIIQCLNKLDAGIDEKVMLTSRDEQSCLIVSYSDLRSCIENTFSELLKKR